MTRDCIKAMAVSSTFLIACFVGAQAYQQYRNAAVDFAVGDMPDVAMLASAYCAGKGYRSAHHYDLAGFVQDGSSMNAVFSSIRCTVASDIPPGGAGPGTRHWTSLKQAMYAEPAIVATVGTIADSAESIPAN